MQIPMPSNLNDIRAAWRLANRVESKPSGVDFVTNKSSVDFYVYDMIGLEDGEAERFVRAVSDAKNQDINLFINSPGGFVWDAVAMYESLVNSASKVNVEIHGLAASAASFLAMSGDTVKISEAGRMMVHDAQGIGIGSPADMREYADLLDSISDDIAGIYAKRTKSSAKSWRKAMNATTWYNSSQAIDLKLADGVINKSNKKDGPDNRTRLIQARARVLNSFGGM